jgi:hypothetical protein
MSAVHIRIHSWMTVDRSIVEVPNKSNSEVRQVCDSFLTWLMLSEKKLHLDSKFETRVCHDDWKQMSCGEWPEI